MNITVETALLKAELWKVQGIVGAKAAMAILQNVLLDAKEDGTLWIHATDLEISFTSKISCTVDQPGRLTLRARDFHDVLKGLKSEKLKLQKEANQGVKLTAGTVVARFVAMNPDEFPQRQGTSEVQLFSVPTTRLTRLIDRVLFSISTDDGRPNLTGALLQGTEDGRLRMASTDGHRLSLISTDLDEGVELPDSLLEGVIVPKKGLHELNRGVDSTTESVAIGVDEKNVVFEYGNTTLHVRTIDGKFPSFTQVIPEENEDQKAIVHRATLIDRIKLVSNFANPRTHSISLGFEDGTCRITAEDVDTGEIVEEIPIAYTGKVVKAGYNFRYLQEILSKIGGDEISVEITDTLSPTIVHELETDEGEESVFIVMPMRI